MSAEDRPGGKAIETLAGVVQAEGRRVLTEAALAPDPARVAAGWERRFVADSRRAEEAMALYQSLGFEAVADPVRLEGMDPECRDCQLVIFLQFRTVYTRRNRDLPP